MSEFGRYGVFIWSAYGVTGLVAGLLVLRAVVGHLVQVRALAAVEARLAGVEPGKSDG